MNTITMWHGGRDLEYSYKESISAKGLWEHGPGLYLTTSYSRARQYAKGGGTTYKVIVQEGNDVSSVNIPIEKVTEFIENTVIKNKKSGLLLDIHSNMKRMNITSHIKAEHFLNLVINLEAIKKNNTDKLSNFLVESGADYGFTSHYGGNEETVMVIFNKLKIKSVKKVIAKEVDLKDYDLIPSFLTERRPVI